MKKLETPQIHAELHDRLTMAHYALGQKLRPADVAGEFECSANTVREVMLRLAAVGLLDYEDQRGFRVTARSADTLRQLTRFRIMLEQQGVTLAIANGGIEWEAQMAAAHHKLSHIEKQIARSSDVLAVMRPWNRAELEFHEALIGASELPILNQTFRMVYARFRQQVVLRERGYGYYPHNVAEHQRILEAALDRDAGACTAAIHDHLARNLVAYAPA